MCNRFRGVKDWSQLPRELSLGRLNYEYNPNVAPTESVPVLLGERGQELTTRMARFGIVLPAKGDKKRPPLLNSRTDTLRKGSFKSILTNRHCVIPAEGFYEWREEEGKKQPYIFERKDGQPLMLAGIWDWSDVKGERVPSFSILTDEPNEIIAPYHDRMPVSLDNPMDWLDADTTLDAIEPLPMDVYRVRAVNPAVNYVREKDIAKIEAD